MFSRTWTKDKNNLSILRDINHRREEIEGVTDTGLTVKFEKIKPLIDSESILDKAQYFQEIKRDEFFPLGTAGMLIGFMKSHRWFINIHMLIMEPDVDIRNFGKFIEEAKKEAKLDDLLKCAGQLQHLTQQWLSRYLLVSISSLPHLFTF